MLEKTQQMLLIIKYDFSGGIIKRNQKIWTYFCEIEAVGKAAYVIKCLLLILPSQSEFYEFFVETIQNHFLTIQYRKSKDLIGLFPSTPSLVQTQHKH